MPHIRIACMLFPILMIALTASADLISPFEAGRDRSFRYSSIELTVGNVPKGMVLILLGGWYAAPLQIAHNDETITVRANNHSILCLAEEDKLSKPFNYDKDRKKLFMLRRYRKEDFSPVTGAPPNLVTIRCTVKTDGPQSYTLVCR